jgi:hypothetical protein
MLTYMAIELVLLFTLKRLRKPLMAIVVLAAVTARTYSQTTQLHYYDPPGMIELIHEIIHAISNVGILILACRVSTTASDPAFPPFETISLLSILALNPYLASISDIQTPIGVLFLPSKGVPRKILLSFLVLRICIGALQSIVFELSADWELKIGIEMLTNEFELTRDENSKERKPIIIQANFNIFFVLATALASIAVAIFGNVSNVFGALRHF